MCVLGAADSSAHLGATRQRRQRGTAAAARSSAELHVQGHVHGATRHGQGGSRRRRRRSTGTRCRPDPPHQGNNRRVIWIRVHNRGGQISFEGQFQGFRGILDHTLADSDCWNVDLLADLAKVIPIIV